MSVCPNGRPLLGLHPEKVSVSNSEIQTYKDCRRKWWLAYYRGLQPREPELVGPLPLGTRIHAALEAYYKYDEDLIETYKELGRVDEINFAQTYDANDDEKVKKFNSELELGRIILEGYLEWIEETGQDSDIEVVGVEEIVSYDPPEFDGRVEIKGKLDLTVRNKMSGFISLLDHKSAASFDTYYKYALMSEQFMLYCNLLMRTYDGIPVDGGIYSILKKSKRTARAKPPFYQRMHIRFNEKALASAWMRTLGTIRDMIETRKALDEGQDHRYVAYPSPGNDCSWKCPFFHGCTMFDDGSAAEEWLDARFVQGDPYERYNDRESGEK